MLPIIGAAAVRIGAFREKGPNGAVCRGLGVEMIKRPREHGSEGKEIPFLRLYKKSTPIYSRLLCLHKVISIAMKASKQRKRSTSSIILGSVPG